jgi:hypothetical protein
MVILKGNISTDPLITEVLNLNKETLRNPRPPVFNVVISDPVIRIDSAGIRDMNSEINIGISGAVNWIVIRIDSSGIRDMDCDINIGPGHL